MDSAGLFGRVLVTGGCGNLGSKLISHLLETQWCAQVISLDVSPDVNTAGCQDPGLLFVKGDLADSTDRRWRDALSGVDAVVHLAARNPYPDALWSDATTSFDMTLNVLEGAARAGVRRLVFASSNHVMGQYKDPPLADGIEPGGLTTALPPGPGTRWFDGQKVVQGSAYAASKLMGERACIAKASLSDGTLTCVSVRIGWCQPGENRPETINAAGLPGAQACANPDAVRDLRWFRGMWLSNRDYVHVMERALVAEGAHWPAPGIVVNGMSANCGMAWDIESTRDLIGFEPQDDIWRHVT